MKEQAVSYILSGDKPDDLIQMLENLEDKVRRCYAHLPDHSLSSEHFCNMLLHDGCYLLRLFMTYTDDSEEAGSDNSTPQAPVTGAGGVSDSVSQRDTLFLCENQIPFFVLQKIHEHVTDATGRPSVLECIAHSVQGLLQAQLYISNKARPAPGQTSHLLQLVRGFFLPAKPPKAMEENTARPRTGRWRRATEYRCHGNIRFKCKDFVDDIKSSILDVSYQGGTLSIPPLRVDSNTWTILRNLMALEEQMTQRYVTAYCVFMSQVAGTVEDVKLLVGAGIVEQFLASDKQVAQGFANLLSDVVLHVDKQEQNYLKPIWHDLDMRCNKWAHRFMGTCREQHCRNGLYTIAFIITAILFASGLMQAVFAVLSYKFKN
uniref:Uncharacterized protein n=2 Tax=Hordeum vulgare subsp. vulgare TaxID=112509 RepID=A0A8I6YG38_HORVV